MPTYQNPNQFTQTAILGMPDLRQQPNSFFVTIDPDSEFTDFQVGSVLKLVSGAGPSILVDIATATEEAIGVIPYNLKKNTFAAGDTVQIFGELSVLYLQTSAAVNRGAKVEFLNTGGSPTVATVSGSNTVLGVALDQADDTGGIIRVQIKPSAAIAS
jgi:Uncharacterized conserved protein (DUF2190)